MPPDRALTPGERLYLIRLACGDGVRKPESAADFSERVRKATGKRYDQATISRLETGGRNWLLEDIDAFAAVDPEQRGRAWLAGYSDPDMGKDTRSHRVAVSDLEGGAVVPAPKRSAAVPEKKRRPA